jgi:hypothetical protein
MGSHTAPVSNIGMATRHRMPPLHLAAPHLRDGSHLCLAVQPRREAHLPLEWVQSVLFKATGQDKSLLSMSSCFNRKKRNRF